MTEHDAFILGVTSFCKKAGLDAEDAAQMTRLLLMPPFRAKPILEKVAQTGNPYMHPSPSQPLQARQQPTQPAPGMQPAAATGGGGGALNTAANLAYLAPTAKGALGTVGSTLGGLKGVSLGAAGLGATAGAALGGLAIGGAAGYGLNDYLLPAMGVDTHTYAEWGKERNDIKAMNEGIANVRTALGSGPQQRKAMIPQIRAAKAKAKSNPSPEAQAEVKRLMDAYQATFNTVDQEQLASATQGLVGAQATAAATPEQVAAGKVKPPDVESAHLGANLTPMQRMQAAGKGSLAERFGGANIAQAFGDVSAESQFFSNMARQIQAANKTSDPRFAMPADDKRWSSPEMQRFKAWLIKTRGPLPAASDTGSATPQRAATVMSQRGNRQPAATAAGAQGATGETPSSTAPAQTTEQAAQTSSSPTPDVADPARTAALEANEAKYDKEWQESQDRMKNPAQAAAAETTAGKPTGETEPAAKTPQTMGEFNRARIPDLEKQKKTWSIKQDGQEVAMGQWGGHSGYRDY